MIEVNGERYNTLSDAAKIFGVSGKTVRDYIKKRIIPEPPKIMQGLRKFDIFPEDYLEFAKKQLYNYKQ